MSQKIYPELASSIRTSVTPVSKTVTKSLCLMLVAMLFAVLPASATHFRFGLVTATRTSETPTTVTYNLNVSLSWRLGAAPSVAIPFTISGGNTGSTSVNMTSVTDPTGGWVNSTGIAVLTLNKSATPTKIEFVGTGKLDTIQNNANLPWDVYTIINTNGPGSTPVSSMPAIINVPVGQGATTFPVPASDPDAGSVLTFGMPSFTGSLNNETEPPGFTINSSTGVMTFNTTSKTIGQIYNALVTVTDNNGNQIMLDFLIQMVSATAPPQFDYNVTPINGTVFTIGIGQNLTFPIKAINAGSGTNVSLSVSGLTSFITTSNFSSAALPATGNPSQTTFNWTSTAAQLGSSIVLNFVATNNFGAQAFSSITINVVSEPPPIFIGSTPVEGSIRSIFSEGTFHDTIVAQSPVGSNVTILYDTIASGSSISPVVPTPGANPGQTVLSWTPTPADFGQHHFTFVAAIASNQSIQTTRHYDVVVNNLPTFTTTPVASATACVAYTYSVAATDDNIPYGDSVDIVITDLLPGWLTLTKTGNGSAVLQGTPSLSDTGTYSITLAAEDAFHHNYSQVLQTFNITVVGNIITGNTTICQGTTTSLYDNVSGGTWSNGGSFIATVSSTGVVSASASGTVTITYTPPVGCAAITVVTVNPLFTLTASAGANGTINPSGAMATCYDQSQSFVITPNPGYHVADLSVDGNSVGAVTTYTVTSVEAPHSIDATFAPDCVAPVVTCAGSVTQSADAGACGAVVNYTAATADGSSPVITYSQNAGTSFNVGITTVTATATNGCGTSSCDFTVTVNANILNVTTGQSNVSCNGNNSGSITTTVTGGTGSYSYSWSDGASGANRTGLAAGTYSVTVTDAGCASETAVSTSATITQPANVLGVTATVTNVSCNAGTNGAIATNVTGGTSPYTYLWNDGSNASGLSGRSAGTYALTVTDANSCTATGSYTVSQPSTALGVTGTVTNVSCNSGSTGAVTTTVSGGTSPYTYLWNTGATTSGVSGRSAGSYSLTVTDANSCTATGSYTVSQPSTALGVTGTVTNVSCNSGSTGAVTTTVSGGTSPYTYLWNTGATTSGVSGRSAGSYSLTVTDANSCTATGSYTVSQPSTALGVTGTVTNVSCTSGNNGAIATSVTGGTSPYTYSWSNGATASGLSSVSAASYSVTVTDANSCSASGSYAITQPAAALSVTGTVTNVNCNGASTGGVSTSVTGGTSTYTYLWNTGVNTSGISSRSAGTYSVTVTDAHNCTATGSYTITQPASPISVTGTVTNTGCNGGTNGGVSTSVGGGTSPYGYAWTGGGSASSITGKAAGTYSVTVTDAHSCTAVSSFTVTQPATLTVTGSVTNVSCSGNNGGVTTTVGGGTSPYTYSWSNNTTSSGISGLTAGSYSVTVTDAHSCTAAGTYSVSTTSGITSTITGNNNVLGGVAYTYTAPSGMTTYSWSISGGNHVCDIHCHHYAGHVCGYGCDHYFTSCPSSCHHHSGHVCSYNHTGDHHCNSACHHGAGHVCNSNCDHYGQPCTSACHHNAYHHCGHQHCGSAAITGSSTGSSVSVVNPCCATTYTLTLTVTQSGCTSTSGMAITVTPSAQIKAYSSLYSTSDGHYPSVSKSAIAADFKVYNRHICGAKDGVQSHYSSVWNGTSGQITNCIVGDPVVVTIGGGPAYCYNITVPAGGHYLCVGKSNISSSKYAGNNCTLYTAQKAGGYDSVDGDDDDDDDDLTPCSAPKTKYHCAMKDNTGKCSEGDTHCQYGSLLLIVSPMNLTFDDSVENLPVVYESVEGDWDASVSAAPPEGFYAIPADSLSTSVTDSVTNMNAVQFYIADTGSVWTNTKLTHNLFHKGAARTAYSSPRMVNNRTNKVTELNLFPNPTDNTVNIVLPRFEGKATVRIYNMFGQKMSEKKINIIGGVSTSVDVSSFQPGVYMVSVENSYSKVTARLIKQ